MTRPPLEVADIVRALGNRFLERNCRWIHWTHCKVLQAIARCRTAALGGHRDQCPRCGYCAISCNSCRNRHCPKCQNAARDRWVAARQSELLAVAYGHVVTPYLTNYRHGRCRTRRSFMTSCSAPARKPFSKWLPIPHVHCLIPAGGLSPDGRHWIHPRYPFFLPVGVLSRVFRASSSPA